ncbi:PAS domain S-box protein [Spirosoma areae]
MSVSHLDFQQAKANHLLFKSRLRAILYDEMPEEQSTVLSQYACAVGRWIYSHALIAHEGISEVQTLEEVHAAIHTTARDLIILYQQGRVDEARQGLIRIEQIADELVNLLNVVEEKVTASENAHPQQRETYGQPVVSLSELLEKNQRLDAKISAQSKELLEKERIFKAIMTASPVALWMSDAKGAITYVNQTWIDWTGRPFAAHLGGGWTVSILEQDQARAAQQFLSDVAARQPYAIDFRLRRQDGAIRWCTVAGQPWYMDQGTFGGYAGSCIDVTERRLTEQALHEKTEQERQRLHDFFMQAPAAHCFLRGPEHIFELANPGYLELVGKRDLLGKPVREALPEIEGQGFLELLDGVFTSREAFIGKELPLSVDKGGGVKTEVFVNFIYQPILNQMGETDGILVFAYEVTDQVEARKTLQENKDQLAFAIEATEMGTWDYNLVTGSAQWSATCKHLFGLPPDAPVTANLLLERVHPDDREQVRQANTRILGPHSDGVHDIIFRTLRDDNGERWVHAKGKTILNEQGGIVRFSGLVFDVTELKQSQEALRQNAQALEQQVQQRTEQLQVSIQDLQRSNENLQQFAYIASHDLQEPLRKIQQFSDLLKSQFSDQLGQGVDYLTRMQSAASRMSTLIRDLLSFSRISTGQNTPTKVPLDKVIEWVLTDLELLIQQTGGVVEVSSLPTVQGDPSQLRQLFQNLLSNALKFRQPTGSPVVRVSAGWVAAETLPLGLKPSREAIAYHHIEVSDNGIGFEEKYLDRIFQVFQRLHGKNEFSGTGIGLAICEKVVANHGGAITATSQPGQGSTFSVYLPV